MQEYKEILNIKEIAKYLNCSVSMIRKLIYDNQIPYFKIGNRYYFNIISIKNWIGDKCNSQMEGEIHNG